MRLVRNLLVGPRSVSETQRDFCAEAFGDAIEQEIIREIERVGERDRHLNVIPQDRLVRLAHR
jgi:hypothetical protein